jgi:very-short-patch-repair endonuclease
MTEDERGWKTTPQVWEQLKPIARQHRHNPTPVEDALWQELRGAKLKGLRFRRQHAVGPFIVDFYCNAAKLVIVVDGPIHETTIKDDANRQAFLESTGLRVLRFTNDEVLGTLPTVLKAIQSAST